jgi:hypothetical protein
MAATILNSLLAAVKMDHQYVAMRDGETAQHHSCSPSSPQTALLHFGVPFRYRGVELLFRGGAVSLLDTSIGRSFSAADS